MTKNRKIAFILIAIGLALPIFAKKYSSFVSFFFPSKIKNSIGYLRLVTPKFSSLDPSAVLEVNEKATCLILFSRLLKPGLGYTDLEGDLVESWNFDNLTKTYLFKLRRNVFFHDGKPLDIEDVVFSIHEWARKESLDNNLLAPIKGYDDFTSGLTPNISGIKKISQSEFSITLQHWSEGFLTNLSMPRFVIFPKNYNNNNRKDYFKNPVATGPFKLVEMKGDRANFEAHSAFHLGMPKIKKISIEKMEQEKAIKLFNAGILNNLIMYNISDINLITQKKNEFLKTNLNDVAAAILAPVNRDMQDIENRKELANFFGSKNDLLKCYPGSKQANQIISPSIMPLNTKIKTDVLTASSSNKSRRHLKLYLSSELPFECFSKILKGRSSKFDINVVSMGLDMGYKFLVRKELPFWIENFEFETSEPYSVLQYFDSRSNEYLLQYPVAELQKMFREIYVNLSSRERFKKYSEINDFLVSNYYVVPLIHRFKFFVAAPQIKGLEFLVENKFIADWYKLYVEE